MRLAETAARLSGRSLFVVSALAVVAACSSGQSESAAPTTSVPPSGPPTAGSSISSPTPEPTRATDAQILLRPDGNLQLLRYKLAANLENLQSMHVEETTTGPTAIELSYDVTYTGRCSGRAVIEGRAFPMVTDSKGRTLLRGLRGDGRQWTEVPLMVGEYCLGGPLNVSTQTEMGTGRTSTLFEAKRIGVEKVAGQPAVHFRRVDGDFTLDSWLAADGRAVRLLKLVIPDVNGATTTMLFSEFDTADPVDPEPSPDQVDLLDAGAS